MAVFIYQMNAAHAMQGKAWIRNYIAMPPARLARMQRIARAVEGADQKPRSLTMNSSRPVPLPRRARGKRPLWRKLRARACLAERRRRRVHCPLGGVGLWQDHLGSVPFLRIFRVSQLRERPSSSEQVAK